MMRIILWKIEKASIIRLVVELDQECRATYIANLLRPVRTIHRANLANRKLTGLHRSFQIRATTAAKETCR
jgi:hypothetical protein